MKRIFLFLIAIILLAIPLKTFADLNDGLVAYYPFDGDATDVIGNYNGKIGYNVQWGSGISGKAYQRLGQDDGEIILPKEIRSGLLDFSVAFWFKPVGNATHRVIYQESIYNTNKFPYNGLTIWQGINDKHYLFYRTNYNNSKAICPLSELLDKFHFIVVTKKGDVFKFYLDGHDTEKDIIDSTDLSNIQKIVLGGNYMNPTKDQKMNGLIDELRFYSRALSESEIKQLYEMGISGCNSDNVSNCKDENSCKNAGGYWYNNQCLDLNKGLVAYYPFDGNAKDYSGNGNDGVEHGGITYVDGVIGKAAKFDGINGWIKTDKNIKVKDLTLSLWINTNYDNRQTFIQTTDGSQWGLVGFGIQMDPLAVLTGGYRAKYPNKCEMHSNIKLEKNKWYLITLIRNTNDKKGYLFINNQLVANCSDPDPNIEIVTQSYLRIGYGYYLPGNYEKYYSGLIDDLRIYNRALSDAEIQALYKMGVEECNSDNLNNCHDKDSCLNANGYWYANSCHSEPLDVAVKIIPSPSTGFAPLNVKFDISVLTDTDIIDNLSISDYQWDFNNDGHIDSFSPPPVNFTYANPGTYKVKCKLKVEREDIEVEREIEVKKDISNLPEEELKTEILEGAEEAKVEEVDRGKNTVTMLVKGEENKEIEVKSKDYTYNYLKLENSNKALLVTQLIDWTYARQENKLKSDEQGLTKPIKKLFTSSSWIELENGKSVPEAMLIIDKMKLEKDLTISITPYKVIGAVPNREFLEKKGYKILSGADITIEDSEGNKVNWKDIEEGTELGIRLGVKKEMLSKVALPNSVEIKLFLYNFDNNLWEEVEGIELSDKYLDNYYLISNYKVKRLVPYVFAYKNPEPNAEGVIYGKIEGAGSGEIIGLYDEKGNLIASGITDKAGIAKINYKIFMNEDKKEFWLINYSNGKKLVYPVKIVKSKNWNDIGILKSEKGEVCENIKLTINSGWNLLGWCGEESSPNKVIGNEVIKTIWKWEDNKWQIWSPVNAVMKIISKYNIESINTIKPGEGFWVNK